MKNNVHCFSWQRTGFSEIIITLMAWSKYGAGPGTVITSWQDGSINWSEVICCHSVRRLIKQWLRHVKTEDSKVNGLHCKAYKVFSCLFPIESTVKSSILITLAALWLCSKHAEYSADLCRFWLTATQTRWTGNSGRELFGVATRPGFQYFFSLLCFYLLMSGLCFWLARRPQSVNNDLAAAAAGHGCQALFPWLAFFHWLPVKCRFRFQKSFSCHTTRWGPDIASIDLSGQQLSGVSLWLRASHLHVEFTCLQQGGFVLTHDWFLVCFLSPGSCKNYLNGFQVNLMKPEDGTLHFYRWGMVWLAFFPH